MQAMPNSPQESREVTAFLHAFFDNYYTRRSLEKVLEMISPDFLYVGLAADEIAHSKAEFECFARQQLTEISQPIDYRLNSFRHSRYAPGCWACVCQLQVPIQSPDKSQTNYHLRLTATMHKTDRGQWLFDLVHVSEAAGPEPGLRFPCMAEIEAGYHKQLGKIISQLMPGGIVSTYYDRGFPLAVINQQFLEMTGYESYTAYRQALQELYLNGIHPEDRSIYIYNCRFALRSGKQCECDYRLLHRDGSYVWVHDICRRATDEEGRTLLVNAVSDINRQMEERRRLEMETGTDYLTGVFNRKGGHRAIDASLVDGQRWLFCLADLDNFKKVNDLYGHKTGDRVLCCIAALLQQTFGSKGTVFRLGGDEFGLFLPHYDDRQAVLAQLGQLADEYSRFAAAECPDAGTGLSVGGVCGKERVEVEQMYIRADENLYRIKHAGKGNFLLTCKDEVTLPSLNL